MAGPGAEYQLGASAKSRPATKQSIVRILHLLHRLAIFIYAVGYAYQCFAAAHTAIILLRGGQKIRYASLYESRYDLLAAFAGQDVLRTSQLINNNVLKNVTTPVNGTVYLENDAPSLALCSNYVSPGADIYDNAFLRSMYAAVARDTSYHIDQFNELELIAPVVDCSAGGESDTTSARFFFLTRGRQDHNAVTLVVLSLSNQQYATPALGVHGSAGVATIQLFKDMRERDVETHFLLSLGYPYETVLFRVYKFVSTTDDGQWLLRSVPPNDDEISVTVQTACRDGFYIKAESEQSNINNAVWISDTEPYDIISRWLWTTTPALHDSWAWVHGVQVLIGMGLLSNLVLLCVATYRNFRAGKWWIGDAFVSISTAQLVNGAAVLVSWFMNEFWSLHEFCLSVGFQLTGVIEIFVHESPMRADLLTVYFSACGLIGLVLREKIDPLFAAVCFHVGFDLRIQLLTAFPRIHAYIVEYSFYFFMQNIQSPPPGQENISPMQLWSTHPIGERNYSYVLRCLSPLVATLGLVILYALAVKTYRRYHPESVHIQRNTTATATSEKDEALTARRRVLTLFEVATGAELENRFGIVSDYETCIFIKGMKFASADGVYSTGFIIANKKYLLQTDDFWSIVLMKVLRRRYKNIYVYEVNGSTVQQTARLVFPHTLTMQDLANINVNVLS